MLIARIVIVAVASLLALVLVACSADGDAPEAATTATVPAEMPTETSAPETPSSNAQGAIDNRSLAEPARDTIFSCNASALGEALDRPWVDGEGVIDLETKPVVEGEVTWESELEIIVDADERSIMTNGLPDHETGDYPVEQDTEAFTYDPNPNGISAQDLVISVPADPVAAAEPSCLSLGPIGIALTGAVIFNALDAEVRDAVANELFDACQGHPAAGGIYHYHHHSPCFDQGASDEHSPLVGYALDGFGIYGPHDEGGALITNAELDECHGHVGPALDSVVEVYHYHTTEAFPYTLGCYRGTPRGR